MNRRPERIGDLLPGVLAELAARHHATNGAPPMPADPDLLARLTKGIRHWTEDPDRCDMEGREEEVAQSLLPLIQASKETGEQPLEQFVDWFRTDLVYKAPEEWPGRVSWFLDALVDRYGGAA